MQKVRLDASGLAAAIAFVPIIGLISNRAQDVPWEQRPVDDACPRSSVCWDQQQGGCGNPLCDCECGGGVFAGWIPEAVAVIILAIVINTAYGWLVGKLVQAGSAFERVPFRSRDTDGVLYTTCFHNRYF